MGKKRNILVIAAVALFFATGAIVYAVATGLIFGGEADKDETPLAEERNILLLGIDARRSGGIGRTDTIMVVNVNPDNGELHLLSIPRDTRVDLNGGYDRINAAYVYGGVEMVKGAAEDLLDIEIDNYAIIDFQGFIEVVDLLGGVKANVPCRMYHPSENIDLQPGVQVLSGYDALGFARYRYTKNGDLDRAQHQQEILEGLREKALRLENIPKIPELLRLAEAYIDTDVPKTYLVKLAANAEKFQGHKLVSSTLPGEAVKMDGLWYYSAFEDQLEQAALPFKKDAVE